MTSGRINDIKLHMVPGPTSTPIGGQTNLKYIDSWTVQSKERFQRFELEWKKGCIQTASNELVRHYYFGVHAFPSNHIISFVEEVHIHVPYKIAESSQVNKDWNKVWNFKQGCCRRRRRFPSHFFLLIHDLLRSWLLHAQLFVAPWGFGLINWVFAFPAQVWVVGIIPACGLPNG